MPRVAVVIPAYNAGKYLDEALESVIAQSFGDWEAVVVDDGGTENLQRIVDLDPRIRVISQRHRGPSVARNTGIIRTQGDYVAFLDADDAWMPNKLQRQVAVMDEQLDVVLCSTSYETMRAREVFGFRVRSVYDLLRGNLIGCLTVMVRREAFAVAGLFDPRYPVAQDWDMWIRLARVGEFVHVPEVLARYRVHPDGISSDEDRLYRVSLSLLQAHLRTSESRHERRAARQGLTLLRRRRGARLYDLFRGNRRPLLMVRAIGLSPSVTLPQLLKFALRRARLVR